MYVLTLLEVIHFKYATLRINDRPASKLVKYMIDIAMAMNYVSGKGLVHRVSYNLLRE